MKGCENALIKLRSEQNNQRFQNTSNSHQHTIVHIKFENGEENQEIKTKV